VTPKRRVRRVLASLIAVVGLLLGVPIGVGACLSAPRYHGPISDHFDGEQFFDDKPSKKGLADLMKWQSSRERGVWPERVEGAVPGPAPERVVDGARMKVTFINHATTLVQLDGMNVLTDPIWSERASPFSFAGPARVRPPGVRFEDLPKIDVVLLSHNHYDHMDTDTLVRLKAAHDPLFVTGLGNDLFLAQHGITAVALDWGGTATRGALKIESVPNQHFSSRGLGDQDATLWTAFVVAGPTGGAFYFGGDTGYGAHFKKVGDAHPGLRLAILPIGAFEPEWFMGPVHVSPAEAVQALEDLGAKVGVGMHFGTFRLADDDIDEPTRGVLDALDARARAGKRPIDFWVLGFGEGRDVP
jgi:L-ascorbate metabolism protein UlaG (beta-lactamase superfamily)